MDNLFAKQATGQAGKSGKSGKAGKAGKERPLADQLRPTRLDQVVGQAHLVGEEGVITRFLASDNLPSMILWGPPGCGKTTLARLIAAETGHEFENVSAISSGTADLKKLFQTAQMRHQDGRRTVLFVDEIHRFNKAQQDVLLPFVEDGTVILIGATTENPSFELNSALLSRAQVLVLEPLSAADLAQLLKQAEDYMGQKLPLEQDATEYLVAMADGDGRYFLNLVEQLFHVKHSASIARTNIENILSKRAQLFDKSGEQHYNLISALHKSMRGSDPDAALYWFSRMLAGGEDPRYLARRLVRFAAEDVGLASPFALTHAVSAAETYERLGSPEGELALANCVVYLATAPKSNAVYAAFKASQAAANQSGSLPPPKHILNAPTGMMKDLGYGAGYQYDHDTDGGFSGQNYFPDKLPRQDFYNPKGLGQESDIKKRLDEWRKKRGNK